MSLHNPIRQWECTNNKVHITIFIISDIVVQKILILVQDQLECETLHFDMPSRLFLCKNYIKTSR